MISTIPWDDYVKIDAVNASSLKQLAISPKQYLWSLRNRRDNASMSLGRAIHSAVLEPEKFKREYVVWPQRRQGKAWEEFQAKHAARSILTQQEHDKAMAIAASVSSHATAARLLSRGKAEQSITWTHKRTGRTCKARLDWIAPDCIVDLKSTSDVTPGRFGSSAARFRYPLQMAFYADGLAEVTGEWRPTKLIAVDQNPPHDVVVYAVPDEVLEVGRVEYEHLIDRLEECERTGHWPGISQDEETLTLPMWAYDDGSDLELTFDGESLAV